MTWVTFPAGTSRNGSQPGLKYVSTQDDDAFYDDMLDDLGEDDDGILHRQWIDAARHPLSLEVTRMGIMLVVQVERYLAQRR